MRGDRLRDAIKLDEDDALLKPTFIDARGQAACEEAAARALQRRASKPGVCSEGLLITYRAVRRNPKCFSHSLRSIWLKVYSSWSSVAPNEKGRNRCERMEVAAESRA